MQVPVLGWLRLLSVHQLNYLIQPLRFVSLRTNKSTLRSQKEFDTKASQNLSNSWRSSPAVLYDEFTATPSMFIALLWRDFARLWRHSVIISTRSAWIPLGYPFWTPVPAKNHPSSVTVSAIFHLIIIISSIRAAGELLHYPIPATVHCLALLCRRDLWPDCRNLTTSISLPASLNDARRIWEKSRPPPPIRSRFGLGIAQHKIISHDYFSIHLSCCVLVDLISWVFYGCSSRGSDKINKYVKLLTSRCNVTSKSTHILQPTNKHTLNLKKVVQMLPYSQSRPQTPLSVLTKQCETSWNIPFAPSLGFVGLSSSSCKSR